MIENKINRIPRILLPLICLAMIAGVLYFGLRPFQFKPANSVEWLHNPDGIRFQRWGIAYSKEKLKFGDAGFTIELATEAARQGSHSIPVLLELYEDSNSRWLLIGQWRSSLILRWSDGRSRDRRKYREVGVRDVLSPGRRSHIVITSGKGGTSIYVDGVLMRNSPRRLPFGSNNGRDGYLALGNFSGGDDQWNGSIYRLAVYNTQLDGNDAKNLSNRSTSRDAGNLSGSIKASYEYAFERGKDVPGNLLVNTSGTGGDISIPETFNIPHKTILQAPWKEFSLKRSYLKDVIVNFFGFIPLGFTFALFLARRSGSTARNVFMAVVAFGFSTSLGIEILQAFMPSRSSSAGDLILNTLGTLTGVLLLSICWKKFR